jgi:hypothetical protein
MVNADLSQRLYDLQVGIRTAQLQRFRAWTKLGFQITLLSYYLADAEKEGALVTHYIYCCWRCFVDRK